MTNSSTRMDDDDETLCFVSSCVSVCFASFELVFGTLKSSILFLLSIEADSVVSSVLLVSSWVMVKGSNESILLSKHADQF